jgi:hypothetical protein
MPASVRAFALEWHDPMMINVLVQLSKRYGWEVQYCTSFQTGDLFRQHFPSAIYHESYDARYGRPPPELAALPWSGIDQPTAEALGYATVLALKQMSRMEIMGGFATHDRFVHFHRLASYWSAVFDRLQPDVVVMPTAPHVVYDYVAYSLAKLRGIRTVMFEHVTTDGMLMAIDRFEDGLPPLTAAYRLFLENEPDGPIELSDRMEKYWGRLQQNYNVAMPQQTREVLAKADMVRAAKVQAAKAELQRDSISVSHASKSTGHRTTNPILRLLGFAGECPAPAPETALPPPPTTEGHHDGRFYSWSEVPDDLARRAARYHDAHLESLLRRYDELAETPDFKQQYVYVALHHQPERSSNPNGGVFDDQDVMIGIIAAALPPGWRVYVKEHPSQVAPQVASERGRWIRFYDAVVAHPNVSIVPLQTASFDLIDNAQAVATITGTSSWEALARGIPTLVFGEAWYKYCPGSYATRTIADCRKALARIAAGERPDPEAVRRFLKVAEDTSFVGYLGPEEKEIAGIDEATNIERLTDAIAACYAASTAKR